MCPSCWKYKPKITGYEIIHQNIALLQQEVDNLEQYIRRDCLEIRGIPAQEEETWAALNETVQRIGEVMEIQVKDRDISISHRLPGRSIADPVKLKYVAQTRLLSNLLIVRFEKSSIVPESTCVV